ITLPFLLLLLDCWPLGRWGPAAPRPGVARAAFANLVREKVPLFVLAAVIALMTLDSRQRHGALVSLDAIPLSARLANALTAYGWYVYSAFCPFRLAALYPHRYANWSAAPALAGALCLLLVTRFALRDARRRPWLLTGWLWFVGALLPVIGFAQGGAQAWADRFSYWPHVGLFVAVAWGLGEGAGRWCVPRLVSGAAAALVLGGLAALTWVQVGYWSDSVTLWEHTLAVTQDNDRAHQHLAACYHKCGRQAEAEAHLSLAYRIQLQRLRRAVR
ncbi:MAG TPA: hypothetical protein VFA26_23755, partial [Gemmataceae bacterium]|nr:hypothetical protein [Gemmataceae bacterium]